jgi:hypothetical protein
VEYRLIDLETLLLDSLNPRHNPVESQREALGALLEGRGAQELLRLAEDISKFGVSPIDLALVIPDGKIFIVLEGNRRVAALKLLKNPGLASGSKISESIYQLSKNSRQIDEIGCIVAESRDTARRWIELRHSGSQQGVGVVGWSPEMQVRFTENYSGQRGRALKLTDALEEAYIDDQELLSLIQSVKSAKITTLGRLVSDPDFRMVAGLVIGDQVQSRFSPSSMRALWYRLLSDLAMRITVSDLKSKGQRADYLASLADVVPSEAERRPARRFEEARNEDTEQEGANNKGTTSSSTKDEDGPSPRPPATPKTQRARPMRLFYGLRLVHVRPKVKDILREAQRIDLGEFPNAGAVLIRVIVELVVAEGIHYIKPNADDHLRDRVKLCLRELDPTQNDQKYAGVRSGLSDPNSLFAVKALHSYLHNPQMHADATSLRAISENYMTFLRDIDGLIGDRSSI